VVGKSATTTSKEQKNSPLQYEVATPTYLKTPKFHADPNWNQLPNATATATQPQTGLENNPNKVGYSKPRQLLTKQKKSLPKINLSKERKHTYQLCCRQV
jgi:hypothetical protein